MNNKINDFKEKLNSIYGSKSELVFNTHFLNREKTFRINTLKTIDSKVVESELIKEGINFKKSNLKDFFITEGSSSKLSSTKVFNENKIYIQELSSALPVYALNLNTTDTVLDFCASPGSKTSLVQMLTNNKSSVVAIEKSRSRFFKLKNNLTNNGVLNVKTLNIDANRLIKFDSNYLNYFDKILVDVPCSTESKIDLNNPDSLKEWRTSNAKKISKLQKGLLNSAFKLLKTGGTLIYSTCTYSIEENELVVDWFLKRNSNAKILDLKLDLKNQVAGLTRTANRELQEDLSKTVRILPDDQFTAFYLAKITKL